MGARMIEQPKMDDKVESEVENVATVEVNNDLEDDINEIEIEEDEDDEEFSLESIESRLSFVRIRFISKTLFVMYLLYYLKCIK